MQVNRTSVSTEKKPVNTQLKEKIFRSALKLFVEKGYHSTSIPDIVKEAGVSTGAIYHHFPSKEDLAKEIHRYAIEEYMKKFNEEVRSKNFTYEKVRAYTGLMFNWLEQDPVMVQYLLYGRPREILNRCLSICSEEGLQNTVEVVEQGISSGEIRPMSTFLAAGVISGIIIRMIELRLDGFIEHSLVEYIEATANNIWLALKN